MNIKNILLKNVKNALKPSNLDLRNLKIKKTKFKKFGNYQIDGIFSILNKNKINLNELLNKILPIINMKLINVSEKIEFVKPGYINIFLKKSWIEDNLLKIYHSNKLGISKLKKKTIIIDYSSPNIGKEMHVGHMRSTIIGDSISLILELLGHKVIRANHIGDWGNQFGMLLAYFNEKQNLKFSEITCTDLENYYINAKKKYDKDLEFKKKSQFFTLKLQKKEKDCINIWKKITNLSIENNQKIYDQLNIKLNKTHIMGESLYNDFVPYIISDLPKKNLAINKSGNIMVILNNFKNKQGKSMGVILKKRNGTYLYSVIDIACIKYRYDFFKAQKIIYYTDSRQSQHLLQVFDIVRKAKYIPNFVKLEHHKFGMVLKKDKTPFKTRSGDTIKLSDLLKKSKEKAKKLIIKKNPNTSIDEIESLSQAIGIGSIKYFELSKNRETDYIFNWDNILSFNGNTAPYIQYAYTRVISLIKKNKLKNKNNVKFLLKKEEEIDLSICLLQFEEIINDVSKLGTPHILCNYLYDLSKTFSVFYENCSIIKTKEESVKNSRLFLSILTSRTLKVGLELLGIPMVEKM
ncbi:argS [Wigglesworthia glossinidia endosymbiont of Glossina brevipalpis]|uniref:Arginine--tRNA ligase n=1 Tax=Wigglesworthia glossinidia brevipalpis TaxID=36870 RepID=SYR_WIGBR|nr:RecName: Full=Arginine--tRNA ligase; AltName: Full=Arginyl-tRNA synthetase; Short=ArgRS [Wigglesworthia glossinidia endosymbiont of Glossina brevipalpis]BAC24275.1 argS [Wigglesworthia glossinidia endosymbiont of Glossina brevipalpis]